MSSIIYNGHEIQDLIINGNQAQLWLNGQKLYPSGEEPGPVDPYNPLGLPPFTVRVKFKSGYTPTMGDSQTMVDATENVWDIKKNSTDWSWLIRANKNVLKILGANSSDVENFNYMCYSESNLEEVQLFDTRKATSFNWVFRGCSKLKYVPQFDFTQTVYQLQISAAFYGCYLVEYGALELYRKLSSSGLNLYPPSCFTDCGRDTVTGAAELAQIPSSWGGTRA